MNLSCRAPMLNAVGTAQRGKTLAMAIKELVVHQGPDSRSGARLGVASALAKAHGGRIVGVFVKADPAYAELWWISVARDTRAAWLSKQEEIAAEAEKTFWARVSAEELEGEWRLIDGDVAEALITCARYADLTVIGQTDPDEPAYGRNMPDQIVLGAGGPVLIVPHAGQFKATGKRIMLAWNGAREAARAMRDAMPLLRRAERVLVHSINPDDNAHLSGAEICAHLARHGVEAEASHVVLGGEAEAVSPVLKTVGGFGFQQRGPLTASKRVALGAGDVGNALLSSVTDMGADLLVMGGYGHSRIHELVLGGATREILASMTVPVIMSS